MLYNLYNDACRYWRLTITPTQNGKFIRCNSNKLYYLIILIEIMEIILTEITENKRSMKMTLIGCWRLTGTHTQNGVGNSQTMFSEFQKASESRVSETNPD